ncbi:uncharacterized protein LOC116113053 [Pistacia vera]|uniref:uncharacterized protein LOC116113053 n=1 Tax=Pistacia vera TaxID=55513 RepID=UPI0012637828|nr:uncharacterized protein LOC116113053 [Pistacia vera]
MADTGSRCMRSQVGPEWSLKEALILVNEIAAVEADCLKALSSYQKWKIISENCTALDVPRSSNQCRRKWDSLVADYNRFMRSRTRTNSYCFSQGQSFPPDFDRELFNAIDNLVREKQNQPDTDSDSDPDAHLDLTKLISQLGSKRRRRRSVPVKHCDEEKPNKSPIQQKRKRNFTEEKPCNSLIEEKSQKGQVNKKSQKCGVEGKIISCIKEKEQMMVAKLHENAELILAIVGENADYCDVDEDDDQDFPSEVIRRQGDKLIACLREIVNTLSQVSDDVQECE